MVTKASIEKKKKKALKTNFEDVEVAHDKKGIISGTVALIIGTGIGFGIIGLPQKTSPPVNSPFFSISLDFHLSDCN